MGIFNPVNLIFVPSLFVIGIIGLPLAFFAGLTTLLAFSVLWFRLFIVYLEIILAYIPRWLIGGGGGGHDLRYAEQHTARQPPRLDTSVSPASSGAGGSGNITPLSALTYHKTMAQALPGQRSPPRRNGAAKSGRRSRRPSVSSITTSVGTIVGSSANFDRDFEGIGGWRVTDEPDSAWMLNSRLGLPTEPISGRQHHQRTPSGGLATPGEAVGLMMKSSRKRTGSPDQKRTRSASHGSRSSISPNSSRIRIAQNLSPFTSRDRDESYFANNEAGAFA